MRIRRARTVIGLAAIVLAALAVPALATPPTTFSVSQEATNFRITLERQAIYDTPAYQTQLLLSGLKTSAAALQAALKDPQRNFEGTLCWSLQSACAGDIRLNNWGPKHYGVVTPVLFTARDGATLSGHIWATVAGPAHRPGIVITDGSVQADEQLYWYAAQTLAKAGYVVMTFDPQGQGQSDVLGETPDGLEGVPAQTDGRPFYDGTEDALNFFLSTPASKYVPVPSCQSGTSHAAKQASRVARHLDAAFNPLWSLLDPSEVGLAGHSYGAAGVSYIAQWDPRVKAVVAWDNLGLPVSTSGKVSGGERPCKDASQRTPAPITKPGLGLSADYGLPPTPNTALPNPLGKSATSLAYTAAGADTGQIIIRGGSHLDFSFIPLAAFGASLRGPDLTDWYTTAWFDKYLKHDPTADARLLSRRWQHDADEAKVDPTHDGNAFSFYYYSRLDIHLSAGGTFDCEDLRTGCAGMTTNDGFTGDYSYLKIDTSPDS